MSKEDGKKDVINRLKTIKGHIAGIEKMIEEDNKSCDDILMQIVAIRSSVHKVGLLIVEEYAKNCLLQGDEELSKEQVEKVLKTMAKFTK